MEQIKIYRKIDIQDQTNNWEVSNLYNMLRHDIPFESISFENLRKFNPTKIKEEG